MQYRNYDQYISTLPAVGSVNTKEGAIALLNGYLALGTSQGLWDMARCLAPCFGRLASELVYRWSCWVDDGGEGDYIAPLPLTKPPLGASFIRECLANG